MGAIDRVNFAAFDLNLLRVFDALMREKSVTRAGEQVGLSQPAVSSALNRLRAILDDQLLVRRGAEMVPTPRAEALAPSVREALAQLERSLAGDADFDPSKAERTYTLLGSDFFATLLMPSLAQRIATAAPGVRLRLLDSAYGSVERLLQEDAIDLALEPAIRDADWLSSQAIFSSAFRVVAAKGDPILADVAPGEAIPLERFCALRHAIRSIDGSLSGVVDRELAARGVQRNVVLGLANFHSVALATARGGMVATLPKQFADVTAGDLGLSIYLLPFESPAPEIFMHWHRRHDRNPAHRWLRELVLELSQALDRP